jgi:hypothetical protein
VSFGPPPVRDFRGFLGLPAALFAVLAGGCGLGEYERKMLEQQARVERLERENKELAAPLELPAGDGEESPPDVYLRPPKGIRSKPEKDLWGGLLHIYPAEGGNFAGVYVGWGKKDSFKSDVLRLVGGSGARASAHKTAPADGRKELALELTAVESGDRLTHLYYEPRQRVAVVYAAEKAKWNAQAVQFSLNTLAFGADAARLRGEYARQKK